MIPLPLTVRIPFAGFAASRILDLLNSPSFGPNSSFDLFSKPPAELPLRGRIRWAVVCGLLLLLDFTVAGLCLVVQVANDRAWTVPAKLHFALIKVGVCEKYVLLRRECDEPVNAIMAGDLDPLLPASAIVAGHVETGNAPDVVAAPAAAPTALVCRP
jgi:hypothetical protein